MLLLRKLLATIIMVLTLITFGVGFMLSSLTLWLLPNAEAQQMKERFNGFRRL